MKYCPSCNFTFPDFHHVCDFDGTELVSASERPALPAASCRQSLLRRCLKWPTLLAALGLIAVVSSVFWIGYLEVVNQTTRVARTEPSTPVSVQEETPPTNSSLPLVAEVSAPAARDHIRRYVRKSVPTSPSVAKARTETASARLARSPLRPRTKATGSQVAQRLSSQPTPHEKQPLLTSMLKTTWRVLKKPFKF